MKINMVSLKEENDKLPNNIAQLHSYINTINNIKNALPLEVANKKDIYYRLNDIIRDLEKIEDDIWLIKRFVSVSIDRYERLEQELLFEANKRFK